MVNNSWTKKAFNTTAQSTSSTFVSPSSLVAPKHLSPEKSSRTVVPTSVPSLPDADDSSEQSGLYELSSQKVTKSRQQVTYSPMSSTIASRQQNLATTLEDLTGLRGRSVSPSPSSLSLMRQTQSVKLDKEGKSAPYDTLLNSQQRQNTKCGKISQFNIVEYSKIGCIFVDVLLKRYFWNGRNKELV